MEPLRHVLHRQSIRTQLMTGVILLLLIFMSLFTWSVTTRQKTFLMDKARQRVQFQAQVIASASERILVEGDFSAMSQLLQSAKLDDSVRYVMITDLQGRILAHSQSDLVGKVLADPKSYTINDDPSVQMLSETEDVFEARAPIMFNGEPYGWVLSGRNLRPDQALYQTVMYISIAYTFFGVLLAAGLAYLFSGRILRQIRGLLIATERITDEHPRAIEITSDNEVGQLTRAFNSALARLAEQREELERAKDDAEAANLAKSNFLANVSHEIRTPLGAVLGFANMLQDSELTPAERQQYQDILTRNGKELQRVIKNLLDISKVESGGIELDIAPFKVRDVVDEVIAILKPKVDKKNLTLWSKVEDEVPEFFQNDSLRVRQVLTNLLDNAIKFTQQGGVALTVRAPNASRPDELRIEIEDTGIGMTSDQRRALFQPFSQVDDSLTRRFGGAGLGLFLARKLARRMGGEISVLESEPNMGTTFLLTLNRLEIQSKIAQESDASEEQQPVREPGVAPQSEKPLSGLHILAVEDVKDNQLLIEGLLTKRGATVECADNGVEGVQKATHHDFNVVLMDIQMPVLDGYRAVKKLRRMGFKKPIVALTAHALMEDREKCLASGFDEYITKPINASDLVSVILRMSEEAS